MNIDNYTDQQIIDELAKAKSDLANWSTGDKRQKRVKYEINFAKAIIARDEHELARRGVAYA